MFDKKWCVKAFRKIINAGMKWACVGVASTVGIGQSVQVVSLMSPATGEFIMSCELYGLRVMLKKAFIIFL